MSVQGPRLKCCERGGRRVAIPRADVLADVAPEDVAAHRLTQFDGNAAAQFDGQVRDTASRVEDVGLDNRVRGAGINAKAAVPALIRRRTFSRSE